MLFWIERSRSRSKVAVPASAKSSSSPISPVTSDWVVSRERSSSSWIWRSRSLRSSDSWSLIDLSSDLPNLTARGGRDLDVDLARVVGFPVAVLFVGVFPAVGLVVVFLVDLAAELLAEAFFAAVAWSVPFLEALLLEVAFRAVFLADVFFADALGERAFLVDDLRAEVFLAGLMGRGR